MIRIRKLLLFSAATIIFLCIAICIQIVFMVLRKKPLRILTVTSAHWASVMIWILNIKVSVTSENAIDPSANYLIVSNHLSYIDVIIIASIIPTLFVAKKDVQSWPVIGWLASLGGTLFIDRTAFRGTKNSVEEIEKALLEGMNVNIFPEGTSTNGETMLPFRSSLFTAPIHTNVSVLPISLNYEKINNASVCLLNRDIVCWYGDMTFMDHFLDVLKAESIEASLVIHRSISTACITNAKDLANRAHDVVTSRVHKLAV